MDARRRAAAKVGTLAKRATWQTLQLTQPNIADTADLSLRKHRWKALRAFCPDNAYAFCQGAAQYLAVEKHQRIQRLVLCRGCDVSHHREMGKECGDFRFSQFRRVPFSVKHNEPLDPLHVGLFSADAVVAYANGLSYLA